MLKISPFVKDEVHAWMVLSIIDYMAITQGGYRKVTQNYEANGDSLTIYYF